METYSWSIVDHFGEFKIFFKKFIMKTSSQPIVGHFGEFKIFSEKFYNGNI